MLSAELFGAVYYMGSMFVADRMELLCSVGSPEGERLSGRPTSGNRHLLFWELMMDEIFICNIDQLGL